jgi:hypothetical protein
LSKVQVDTIDTRSGTSTMQIGSTNTSTINLGVSGDTINVPAGVTIANAGTATGFAPIGISSSMTSGTGLNIDADGHVTKPLNTAFAVGQTSSLTLANGHTMFSTGTTEQYDVNSDFSGGTFTAPVTGKYIIFLSFLTESLSDSATNFIQPRLVTSNRDHRSIRDLYRASYTGKDGHYAVQHSYLADMDANDTAHFLWGAFTATIAASAEYTTFRGVLVG